MTRIAIAVNEADTLANRNRYAAASRASYQQMDNIARRNGYANWREALNDVSPEGFRRFERVQYARYGRNTRLGLGSGR